MGEAYAKNAGIVVEYPGVHGLHAIAATNGLKHDADITKVQMWLWHSNISTTRFYHRRGKRQIRRPLN
ncbi:hypothetical protein ALQ84_200208 [Pseudomonas caricapapayae]|uniref:Tyr recombinase domain-containing protein n=1 Tax=Pseudomonas caricapapayae TaxID=46678 RepID=A0A3M3BH18_9PSED|nr:hypothetical protein ALQ84_200208 [Pseudomonas caricapapayae]RMV96407.1 hypothetical protein ALP01_200221 [Pseudomonas caricapapayae]